MEIVVFTNSEETKNEHQTLISLFQNGLNTLHIRKPGLSRQEMEKYIQKIPVHFYPSLVLHSHHILAGKYKLGGLHLRKKDRKRKFRTSMKVRYLRLKNKELKVSTTFGHLKGISNPPSILDYLVLSPVFKGRDGSSKSPFSQEMIQTKVNASPIPVIALGGINIDSLPLAYKLGFKGVGLLKSFWDQPDPVSTFIQLIEKNNRILQQKSEKIKAKTISITNSSERRSL